jgi:hypothetical protein
MKRNDLLDGISNSLFYMFVAVLVMIIAGCVISSIVVISSMLSMLNVAYGLHPGASVVVLVAIGFAGIMGFHVGFNKSE